MNVETDTRSPVANQVAAGPDLRLRAWRTLVGRVFADLGRARITPRQALIMELLVRVTLSADRQSVRIPRLEMFSVFGLSRGNVSDALRGRQSAGDGKWVPGLVELGLLQLVESNDGGTVFTILPDAAQWRCDWRFTREAVSVFLRHLDAVADQVQPELSALARDPGLLEAWAEVSLENAAVPNVGTDPPRSHIGNEPQKARSHIGNNENPPRLARPAGLVPTLGTAPVFGTPVPNVPETFKRFATKRLNVKNSTTRGPGGTTGPPLGSEASAFGLMERVRRFVGQEDWQGPWNSGRGWQGRLFYGESLPLSNALHFCESGLQTGEIILKKTRGALLWNEFQRLRRPPR